MAISRMLFTSSFVFSLSVIALAQRAPVDLNPAQATKLAEFMCRQLPNVSTILDIVVVETKGASSTKEPAIVDDVHDALIRLGRYSLPGLINKMADTRWMPDPREEPLLGAPVVGDIAYTTLMDKGVPDFLPQLTHKS
jgi:hypothetical protein